MPPSAVQRAQAAAATDPASALRRALLLWGAGHLAMGLRRGWLMLAAEVAFIVALVLFLLPRATGTSDDLVFTTLALFFVAWVAQAVDAYRIAARALDREPPIEVHGRPALLLLALVIPATLVFTTFWMAAGRGATPESALEHYVVAWRAGEPDRALGYLAAPRSREALDAEWREQGDRIASRLRAIAGVDADRPFRNLEFVLGPDGNDGAGSALGSPGMATAAINVVRRVQVHDTFLGLFPTASLRTAVIEQIGTVRLTLVELPPPLGLGPPDHAWRVERVEILPPG